jgi:sec-independent protein translocase protein TatA
MGSLSIWHWLIVILVVVLLFGRNKISDLMGDVARGVKSFKKGLSDDDEVKAVDDKPAVTMDVEATREKSKAT